MSGLYCIAKQRMLGQGASLSLSESVYAALIKSSYTFDVTAQTASLSASLALTNRALSAGQDSFTSDVLIAHAVAGSISSSNGITFFDGDDAIFISVSTGQVIHGILIYKRVTNDTDSLPVAFINISTTTANGATINVNWDNGVNRIFALTG